MIILISTTTETLLAVLLTWKLQMGSGTQRQEICRLLLRLCCGRSPSLRRDAGLGCTGLLGLNHDAAGCDRGCSILRHFRSHNDFLLQAERVLDGQWKLVYTSNSELFGLLALSRLPFVAVGDITQTVQASTLTVENKVRRGCPPAHASLEIVQHCKPEWQCEEFRERFP